MNRPEQQIQKALFAHIRARALPGVVAWHCPNGVHSSVRTGAALKAAGVVAGMPDVHLLHRGAFHTLELKAGRNKPTLAQRMVMNDLELAGARVAVAHSLDEAIQILESWGLLRRDVGGPTIIMAEDVEAVE